MEAALWDMADDFEASEESPVIQEPTGSRQHANPLLTNKGRLSERDLKTFRGDQLQPKNESCKHRNDEISIESYEFFSEDSVSIDKSMSWGEVCNSESNVGRVELVSMKYKFRRTCKSNDFKHNKAMSSYEILSFIS
uniref:Uncharacterized protein n=1 Tax=Euplotes harpa TaxID=151035 RepID=A0A7S3JBT2_9SPIT|mmetsp:Transcript_26657/g.30791  ORF Transcript_26657/g.30791 Transcript_26657/m.30791 type:complete len:137 (+) Transcript_26657:30-440(+)